MIQATGFVQLRQDGTYFKDPTLLVEFHGTPMGGLAVDLCVLNESGTRITTVSFSVQRETLTFNPLITDPYDCLLDALQTAVADFYAQPGVTLQIS